MGLGLFMRGIRKSLVGSWSGQSNLWDFEFSKVDWLVLLVSDLLLNSKQLGFSLLDKIMTVIDVILEGLDMLLRIFKDSQ